MQSFDQTNKRFEQMDKRFEALTLRTDHLMLFLYCIATITVGGIIIATMRYYTQAS